MELFGLLSCFLACWLAGRLAPRQNCNAACSSAILQWLGNARRNPSYYVESYSCYDDFPSIVMYMMCSKCFACMSLSSQPSYKVGQWSNPYYRQAGELRCKICIRHSPGYRDLNLTFCFRVHSLIQSAMLQQCSLVLLLHFIIVYFNITVYSILHFYLNKVANNNRRM